MHTVIKGPSEQKTKLVSLISKQNKSFMLDFLQIVVIYASKRC